MKRLVIVMCLFMAVILSVSGEDKKEFEQQWEKIEPDIFELHVKYDMPFHKSITYLTKKWLSGGNKFHYHSENVEKSEDFSSESEANVLIEGNCTSKIILKDGGMIHIKGDLLGSIEMSGQGEIIIAGSIKKGATIKTNGIVRILIAGNMDGRIENIKSSKCFIKNDFNGVFITGTPSAFLYIYGNYKGEMTFSGDKGHLFYILVEGFMSLDKIKTVMSKEYNQVGAFINKSNAQSKVLQNRNQVWYIKTPNKEHSE